MPVRHARLHAAGAWASGVATDATASATATDEDARSFMARILPAIWPGHGRGWPLTRPAYRRDSLVTFTTGGTGKRRRTGGSHWWGEQRLLTSGLPAGRFTMHEGVERKPRSETLQRFAFNPFAHRCR